MYVEWGKTISEAYAALDTANQALAQGLRADIALPTLLPTYTGSPEPASRREAAVASMTRMFRYDGECPPLEAGLVCASPATLEVAHRVNEAKLAFKEHITSMRKEIESRFEKIGNNLRIDHLLQRALSKDRDFRRQHDLNIVLRNLDLARMDLIACYTQIRILEPQLKSISWTWARTRYTGVRVSHKEALLMSEELDGDERQQAIQAISRFPADACFIQVKAQPTAQLRANLMFHHRTPPEKSISVAGILLSPDPSLPIYVWRDRPADGAPQARLKRRDTRVSDRPLIPALRLHSYIQGDSE